MLTLHCIRGDCHLFREAVENDDCTLKKLVRTSSSALGVLNNAVGLQHRREQSAAAADARYEELKQVRAGFFMHSIGIALKFKSDRDPKTDMGRFHPVRRAVPASAISLPTL